MRSRAGCRCTPSAMSSTSTGESSSAPTGPGSRWWSGRIALKRWVPRRAPASRAARAWSYVASVWPIAASTPASTSRRTASMPPGSSGARVTIRTAPSPAARSASTDAGSGVASEPGWWAPERCGLSHGPSRWMPASRPSCTSRASSRTASTIRSRVSVTRLAAIDVVPWARWVAATRSRRVRRTAVEGRAATAVHVEVDEPGTDGESAEVDVRRVRWRALADLDDAVAVEVQPPRREDPRRGDHLGGCDDHVRPCCPARASGSTHRLVVVLATRGPQVPLPDHEPEQEVVDAPRRPGRSG